MARSRHRKGLKRIAIVIELDQPYPHHLGCYEGILRYAATKDDWQTIVDPFVVGVSDTSGIREYDGIVGRITKKAGDEALEAGLPVVNHWINSPARGLPSVLPDSREGGRMAAEHLLARGFRHFGYIGSVRDRSRQLHLSGFEPPIRERGIKVDTFDAPLWSASTPQTFCRFYNRLKDLLGGLSLPAAFLVPLAVNALYVVQVCGELGLRVPHDVGVIVCRENLTICLQSTPTLSCIQNDNERIGYCAAELLDRIMLGESEGPTEPIWIEPKALRVRGSSDAFVSNDPLVSHAMRFMAEHSQEAIKVEDVAEAVDTSTRTLQQRFARNVGRSVYSEISRLRMETVKRLLLDSDASLEKLAADNGFTDLSHLVKSFRKATGMTPGAFRKRHRPHR